MRNYKFNLYDKALFYLSYIYYRFFLAFFEIKKEVFKYLLKSLILFIQQAFHLPNRNFFKKDMKIVCSKYGTFHVRPGTLDFFFISPAFERPDVNYTRKLIASLLEKNAKVLFIDIGADIGTYSVQIGNSSKSKIDIVSIEPSNSSFTYLTRNLEQNNLTATTFNCALSNYCGYGYLDFDAIVPGNSNLVESNVGKKTEKIQVCTLDSLLNPGYYINFDTVVVKMDIEGGEINCLAGALNLINNSNELYLLVEDFFDSKIINHLKEIGFTFLIKKTPYNSWWYIKNKRR